MAKHVAAQFGVKPVQLRRVLRSMERYFTAIGIPAPHIMAPFVGVVEIVCGSLVVVGLLTCPIVTAGELIATER